MGQTHALGIFVLAALLGASCTPDSPEVVGDGSNAGTGGSGEGGNGEGGSGDSGGTSGGGSGGEGPVVGSCGDGVAQVGEECDDGNDASDDGCSPACTLEEVCPAPPCTPSSVCGDGRIEGDETCDDGGATSSDGCDALCRVETGFTCTGAPSVCTGCPAAECPASCGDGQVIGTEQCDDGAQATGDGCDSDCNLESGHVCSSKVCDAAGCTWHVPATYRDFNAAGALGGHPDFQPLANSQFATPGLVLDELDAEGKPVFSGAPNGNIQSVGSFAQWYRDDTGINTRTVGTLTLFHQADNSTFVNRWNEAGDRWRGYPLVTTLGDAMFCSATGCDDPACTMMVDPTLGRECVFPCEPWGQSGTGSACVATVGYFDGDPTFFPLDDATNVLPDTRYTATIPPAYGYNYTDEPGGALHNFHFTSEIRLKFRFRADSSLTLLFTGDDDIWVFVNGRLALDLGGWHPPLDGSVMVGGGGETYGLSDGQIYEVAVFHAERQLDGSTFRLAVTDLEPIPSCMRVE